MRQHTRSLQDYFHKIKPEFCKVPDLTTLKRLNFFAWACPTLSVLLRPLETGTLFSTMEYWFHYLQ